MNQPATLRKAVCCLVVALLTGCAVKPKPLLVEEKTAGASANLAAVTADQEPVGGTIDLYEAMARALKYNLDSQVADLQKAVKVRELDLSHYKLLPNLVVNTGYTNRSNDSGGSSRSLLTGLQSLESSTSERRWQFTDDLSFSWNILDFGLS